MPHVLVLDGFDESRDRTLGFLRLAGYTAVGVAEEEETLAVLLQRKFDVVVLDVPIDEGIEAAIAIRAQCGLERPKVLAFMEPNDTHERERARVEGIDFLVLRPCPPAELTRHVRRFAP